jgi:ATP-dependent DNA helicase DinG
VNQSIALPDAPAVVAGHGRAAILTPDGELLVLPTEQAAARLRDMPPPIVVHAPATFRRRAGWHWRSIWTIRRPTWKRRR